MAPHQLHLQVMQAGRCRGSDAGSIAAAPDWSPAAAFRRSPAAARPPCGAIPLRSWRRCACAAARRSPVQRSAMPAPGRSWPAPCPCWTAGPGRTATGDTSSAAAPAVPCPPSGAWRRQPARAAWAQEVVHGRAEAVPARQGQAALAPAEAPGNGAQVLDALGRLARRRPRTDVEFRDLADRRRAEEVLGETRRLVDQGAIRRHAGARQRLAPPPGRPWAPAWWTATEWPPAWPPPGSPDCAGRSRGWRTSSRSPRPVRSAGSGRARCPAAAPGWPGSWARRRGRRCRRAHGTCAAGSDGRGQSRRTARQRDLGPVQLPVAGEDAAVLVAVAVAQHDVLLAAGALHQRWPRPAFRRTRA